MLGLSRVAWRYTTYRAYLVYIVYIFSSPRPVLTLRPINPDLSWNRVPLHVFITTFLVYT